MKKQSLKENLRNPYYESGDHLYLLLERAKKIQDEELIESIKKTIKQHQETQNILNKKYLWD